jgi:hypothetical protein
MQQRLQTGTVTDGSLESSSLAPRSLSRRWLLRVLPGAAIGLLALLGLTSCGGDEGDEGDEDNEGDDD